MVDRLGAQFFSTNICGKIALQLHSLCPVYYRTISFTTCKLKKLCKADFRCILYMHAHQNCRIVHTKTFFVTVYNCINIGDACMKIGSVYIYLCHSLMMTCKCLSSYPLLNNRILLWVRLFPALIVGFRLNIFLVAAPPLKVKLSWFQSVTY